MGQDFGVADSSFGDSENEKIDEFNLLSLYTKSIPPEFDIDLLETVNRVHFQYSKVMRSGGLRLPFAINSMQGNHSRSILEDAAMTLAEKYNLKAGILHSKGGSKHLKISTEEIVLTLHTLGDREGKMSRFAQYKRLLSRNNPKLPRRPGEKAFTNNNEMVLQGELFIDADIGKPEALPENVVTDSRIHFTICWHRFNHKRNDVNLVVPSRFYSGMVMEFKYCELRDFSQMDKTVNIYTENKVERKKLTLKEDNSNEILPKRLEQGKYKDKEEGQE